MNASTHHLRIEPLTRENWEACAQLALSDEQKDFIPSALHCIAELQFWPDSRGYAIYKDSAIVGLVVFGKETGIHESWKIFRFLIDVSHQKQGLGKAAAHLVISEIKKLAAPTSIRLCYHPRNLAAKNMYHALGFREIELQKCNRSPEGKILAVLSLDS